MKLIKSAVWAVACSAAASVLEPRQESPAKLDEMQMANLTMMAQYAGAAYCNSRAAPGTVVTCANDVCPVPQAHGAVVQSTFSGFLSNIRGYIAVDPVARLVVVSFRGTNSQRNGLTDLLALPIPCRLTHGCLLHAGFYAAWTEVRGHVLHGARAALAAHPGYSVAVAGHSLGGAVATLAGAYLRRSGLAPVDVFTYGSPRVGNEAFAAWASSQPGGQGWRVTHKDDPVPRLPPMMLGYRHVGPEYWHDPGVGAAAAAAAAAAELVRLTMCPGTANVDCNGGTTGLDVMAHSYYLGRIAACWTPADLGRREVVVNAESANVFPLDVNVPGLAYMLNLFSEHDRRLAAVLAQEEEEAEG